MTGPRTGNGMPDYTGSRADGRGEGPAAARRPEHDRAAAGAARGADRRADPVRVPAHPLVHRAVRLDRRDAALDLRRHPAAARCSRPGCSSPRRPSHRITFRRGVKAETVQLGHQLFTARPRRPRAHPHRAVLLVLDVAVGPAVRDHRGGRDLRRALSCCGSCCRCHCCAARVPSPTKARGRRPEIGRRPTRRRRPDLWRISRAGSSACPRASARSAGCARRPRASRPPRGRGTR